jgi:hypothetical protein
MENQWIEKIKTLEAENADLKRLLEVAGKAIGEKNAQIETMRTQIDEYKEKYD